MCEILAVNVNRPAPVMLAWRSFGHRGACNPDGWGYAYLEDDRFKEQRFLTTLTNDPTISGAPNEVRTSQFLGHVRYKVQGEITPENTQSFLSSVDACAFTGTMSNCRVTSRFREEVGEMLNGDTGPEVLFALLRKDKLDEVLNRVFLSEPLGPDAMASFVFAHDDLMHVFSFNKSVYYLTRFPPYQNKVRLKDPNQPEFEASLCLEKKPDEVATLLASVPLTNERWSKINHGELLTVRQGRVLDRRVIS